jgi:hypothetical protein
MPGPLPSVHASTPPPRALSQSPPNASGNKASLSALLHPNPTPSNSEPTSAAGSNSATSSPRGTGAAMGTSVISSAAMGSVASAGLMAKGFHEDARALDVLNKKFSIWLYVGGMSSLEHTSASGMVTGDQEGVSHLHCYGVQRWTLKLAKSLLLFIIRSVGSGMFYFVSLFCPSFFLIFFFFLVFN